MAEINQRDSQFIQVPREIYSLSPAGRGMVIENFFEALAAASRDVVRQLEFSEIPAGDYTVTNTDFLLLLDATDGDINVTHLPAVGHGGHDYLFKRIDSTSNTVTVSSVDNIDGDGSFILYPFEVVRTYSDNATWWIV